MPSAAEFLDTAEAPPNATDFLDQADQAPSANDFLTAPEEKPRREEISAAPTIGGEIMAGRYGSAARLIRDKLENLAAPTQPSSALRAAGEKPRSLLGTDERIPYKPDDSFVTSQGKAIINWGNAFMSGLTSPEMVSAAPLALIPGVGQVYAADIAAHLPDRWAQIKEAEKTKDWSPQRTEAALGTISDLLMIAGGAKAHAPEGVEAGALGLSDVKVPGAGDFLDAADTAAATTPVAKVPFREDPGIPFMAKARIEDQLAQRGIPEEQVAGMSGEEATALIYQPKTEVGGRMSEVGGVGETPAGTAVTEDPSANVASVPVMITKRMEAQLRANGMTDDQINKLSPQEANAILSKSAPATRASAGAEQQARAEMEAQMATAGADQGRELLDAVEQAGGLPSKTNEFRGAYAGELARLEENMKPGQKRSLFSTDAPDLDELTTRLRDHGFDVQTPDDTVRLLEQRLRNEKPMYGTPELAAVFSREPLDKTTSQTQRERDAISSQWVASPDPEARSDVARLGRVIDSRRLPGDQSLPVSSGLRSVDWPAHQSRSPDIAKAEALARVTGTTIRWFRDVTGRSGINGAAMKGAGMTGKIFIRTDTAKPFNLVAAHEITHRMQYDAPDLYKEYHDAIVQLATRDRARFDRLSLTKGYPAGEFNHELVANFTEETLRDPAKFAEALGGNPTLYQRVRQFISELLEKLQRALGQRSSVPKARETIADLKQADAAMQRAFDIYRTKRITEEPGQNFEVAFSREIPSQKDFEDAANDKEKMRGHIATVERMTEVSPDVKARVESWYSPTTLTEVTDRANATIDKLGLGKATDQFMRSKKADADTLALGHHVSLRLDALGRFDEAAMVRDAMAERLTSPAQAMWFISTIGKTSPEGLVREAQKIVTDQIKGDPEKMQLLEQIERLKTQLGQIQDEKARGVATEIVIRQLAKVNKPGQRLTPAQLENLLDKHKAGKLSEEDLATTLTKYFKIPRLTPENIAKIKAAQRTWAETSDPIMKLRRGAEMMDSVYGLVPRSFWDKVRAAATISMILHGRLPVRIGASNLLQMSGQMAVDAISSVTLDPMLSIITGKRTVKGMEFKARISGLAAPAEAFRAGYRDAIARDLGRIKSFKEGVRTLLDLSTMTTRGIQETNEMAGRGLHTFSSRFGRLAEDTVTLLHNTVPYAFWNAGYKASLARQMRIAGLDTPTAEMIGNARLDANKAIFQNETAAYQMLKGVRRVLDFPTAKITGGKYGIGTATVPFAKVPGAILTEGATWTPLGFVRSGWEAFRPLFTKEGFRQKEFGDAFIKAVIGTGSMVATGYWLSKLGIISAAPDENKNIEAMRRSTGFGQFRLNASELKRRFLSGNFHTPMRIPFGQDGDVTYSYNWVEPFAFPIAMGADIAHSQDKREIDLKKGKITSNAIVSAAAAGVGTLTTHPMLQNLENLQRTGAEQGWAPAMVSMLANVPGNFVPSLVRQTSQYIDNVTRETRGGSIVDQAVSRLAVQIPWLSQRYPARYDIFGDAVQRYNYGENSLVNIFFNPAQPDRIRKNPNVNELMNLWNATGEARAIPGQVQRSITINKHQVSLDNEQLATYQRYVGQLASTGITRLLASPEFASEPAPTKQAAIVEVLDAVHEAAKIDLFGQQQYSIGARGQVRIASPYAFSERDAARRAGLNRPVTPLFP